MSKSFVRLNRLAIRRLAPGQQITEHGISVERLSNGDTVYSVNVMVDGIRIHRVIGRESEGVTRTQAESFIEQARTDARHDRLSLSQGRKVAISLRQAASKYLTKLESSDGKNLGIKRRHLEQKLVPFFGDTPLSKITTHDVDRYKKYRLTQVAQIGGDRRSKSLQQLSSGGKTTSSATVNRELATLSHLYSMAAEWKWITTIKPRMKRLQEGDGRIVYLTAEQAARFLSACQNSDSVVLYPFVLIALETSMRKSEVLAIRKADIDLERRLIHIPQAKAGAREQPITTRLQSFLKRYLKESVAKDSPWLFPTTRTKSKSGHVVSIEKPFRKAVIEAGLDVNQVVRHTLRHTAVSHLVQSGVDLPTVKRISGHKTLQMVEKYAHQNGAHIQAAMDKLQRRMKHRAAD